MALKAKMLGREALTKKLNAIAPEIDKEAAKAIEAGARELAGAIQARAPREDGDYVNSIQADRLSNRPSEKPVGKIRQTKDENAWGVFAEWYWRFLEFGTKAHVIKPRKAKRLAWKSANGETVTAAQVKHPGSSPQPHIFPTFRALRKRIRSRIARAVNKAAKKAMAGGVNGGEAGGGA